ncbi:MAG: 50S ribosomal protein L4 [bacterium]
MQTKLFDKTGKETGKVKLNDKIFKQDINKPLLWENITALSKNQRRGIASAKNKTEVRGGGKKPYRQKGTGWARHGTIRSPIWRGGGVVFGPKPRDYSVRMPKKKKIRALLSSLSVKAQEDKIMVIENLDLDAPKTKNFAEIIRSINLHETKTLIGVDTLNENLKLAGRNIPYINLKRVDDINCLDVLSAEYFLLTKKGLEKLEKRCATKK